MRRTFVVGCPRSGTTIVQALLARHPAIYTLPETAFFEQLHGDLALRWGDARVHVRRVRRWRQTLGLTRRHARETYAALHAQLTGKRPAMLPAYHQQSLSQRFLSVLDRSAATAGRSMWLEKTPNHLLYIPEIEAVAPDARFVHVIRRGMDVLASLADVYLRFENDEAFGGGTVHWARRWNRAMDIHGQHVGRAHHHFIFLEDLVARPDSEWARLCAFLELSPDAPLESANHQSIANLKDEPWKVSAIEGRVREADRKVDSLFGPKLQRWLHEHLASYEDLHAQCLPTLARTAPRICKVFDAQAVSAG